MWQQWKRKQTRSKINKQSTKQQHSTIAVTPNYGQAEVRMLNQTETVTQVGAIHTNDNTLFPQSDDSSMHQPKTQYHKYGATIKECLKIFNDNVH